MLNLLPHSTLGMLSVQLLQNGTAIRCPAAPGPLVNTLGRLSLCPLPPDQEDADGFHLA
jgi:hypothetical protein